MSVDTFFDTSVLVKLFDPSVPAKQTVARSLLESERKTGGPTVSYPILAELFHGITKSRRTDGQLLPPIFSRSQAAEAVEILRTLHIAPVTEDAFSTSLKLLAQRPRLGSWDALHLGTAAASRCRTFLTWDTDFPDGGVIEGVRIRHPPF